MALFESDRLFDMPGVIELVVFDEAVDDFELPPLLPPPLDSDCAGARETEDLDALDAPLATGELDLELLDVADTFGDEVGVEGLEGVLSTADPAAADAPLDSLLAIPAS